MICIDDIKIDVVNYLGRHRNINDNNRIEVFRLSIQKKVFHEIDEFTL